jgi:hypothetical protein
MGNFGEHGAEALPHLRFQCAPGDQRQPKRPKVIRIDDLEPCAQRFPWSCSRPPFDVEIDARPKNPSGGILMTDAAGTPDTPGETAHHEGSAVCKANGTGRNLYRRLPDEHLIQASNC